MQNLSWRVNFVQILCKTKPDWGSFKTADWVMLGKMLQLDWDYLYLGFCHRLFFVFVLLFFETFLSGGASGLQNETGLKLPQKPKISFLLNDAWEDVTAW